MAPLIHLVNSLLGNAPTFCDVSLPSLNIIKVGMERMPSLPDTAGFSSTFNLVIFTLPPISLAISSSDGPIILQGPHHSAQKSTTTGTVDFRTSASNEASVILTVDMVPSTFQIR